MKFQIIVADPPWAPADQLKMSDVKRGSAANYNVMTVNEIRKLPVAELADPDGCVLALWVLGSMLEEGMQVMRDWGFKQKQVFTWVKTKKQPYRGMTDKLLDLIESASKSNGYVKKHWRNYFLYQLGKATLDSTLGFGMGRLFRQTHEICLIGINNNKIYRKLEDKSQRSVCFDTNKGHSVKPEALQDRLDIMFPDSKKLEMFSRRNRKGWVNIGDEISNEDILRSIDRLKDYNEKGAATQLDL
jgi:N6-adenosine-specific RNA methylase IME4